MKKYPVAVIERIPDGTKWVHYFDSKSAAALAVGINEEAHPERRYEIVEAAS